MRINNFSRLKEIFKHGDVFAKPVALRHEDYERYSTWVGLAASFGLVLSVVAYFAFLLVTPFDLSSSQTPSFNWNSKIISNKDVLSMSSDTTLPKSFSPFINTNSTGIPFALSFSPGIDSTVATMEVYLKQFPSGTSNPTLTNLPIGV